MAASPALDEHLRHYGFKLLDWAEKTSNKFPDRAMDLMRSAAAPQEVILKLPSCDSPDRAMDLMRSAAAPTKVILKLPACGSPGKVMDMVCGALAP